MVAIAALAALPALAQPVYRWMDAAGEEHFTDDPSSIPAQYRKGARTLRGVDLGHVVPSRPEPAPAVQADRPETSSPAEGATDAGQTEQRREEAREKVWREAFRLAHERVDGLETSLTTDRAALTDPVAAGLPVHRLPNGTVVPSPEFEALKERVALHEAELVKARDSLDDLERRASREAVPRKWRR